jgi:hypothetical protein
MEDNHAIWMGTMPDKLTEAMEHIVKAIQALRAYCREV